MNKCKICGFERVDDYGCLRCLMRYANNAMWKRLEDKENE